MMSRVAIVLCSMSVFTTACATPTVRALEGQPSPTSYWSFLWPLQTAWQSATPAADAAVTAFSTPLPADAAALTATQSVAAVPTDVPTSTFPTIPIRPVTPTATPTSAPRTLRATVTAGLLSCRYGPGPEYLYLYALRQGANITLIGRADGDNWHWAWVDGRNKCWVNTSYLRVEGDWRDLPIVYPGIARLPTSPYYPPTSIISVVRLGNSVTVEWAPVRLRAGDEEDEYMQHYILEVWHCTNGALIFEPLATNDTFLTLTDEPGCSSPSHGRLFVQEKHGFSGPTEVPWRAWR